MGTFCALPPEATGAAAVSGFTANCAAPCPAIPPADEGRRGSGAAVAAGVAAPASPSGKAEEGTVRPAYCGVAGREEGADVGAPPMATSRRGVKHPASASAAAAAAAAIAAADAAAAAAEAPESERLRLTASAPRPPAPAAAAVAATAPPPFVAAVAATSPALKARCSGGCAGSPRCACEATSESVGLSPRLCRRTSSSRAASRASRRVTCEAGQRTEVKGARIIPLAAPPPAHLRDARRERRLPLPNPCLGGGSGGLAPLDLLLARLHLALLGGEGGGDLVLTEREARLARDCLGARQPVQLLDGRAL